MAEKPTRIAWERRYEDDGGVEWAVRYDAVHGEVEIEAQSYVLRMPTAELGWFRARLQEVSLLVWPEHTDPPETDDDQA